MFTLCCRRLFHVATLPFSLGMLLIIACLGCSTGFRFMRASASGYACRVPVYEPVLIGGSLSVSSSSLERAYRHGLASPHPPCPLLFGYSALVIHRRRATAHCVYPSRSQILPITTCMLLSLVHVAFGYVMQQHQCLVTTMFQVTFSSPPPVARCLPFVHWDACSFIYVQIGSSVSRARLHPQCSITAIGAL